MNDPITGIFGPSAQEKMRAQTLALHAPRIPS